MDDEVAHLLANAADALRGLIGLVDDAIGESCVVEREVVKRIDSLLDQDRLRKGERIAEDGGVDFQDPEVIRQLEGPADEDIPF